MTSRWRISFFVALFFVGVGLLFQPPLDPDFGWHISYGKYLFENHTLLRDNIFSYNFPHYSWANSYWLSELIMYVLFRYIGSLGLSLVFSGILSIFLIFFTFKCLKSKNSQNEIIVKSLLVYLLYLSFSTYLVSVRPMFFSTIFMTTLICTLHFHYAKYKYLLPFLFLLWANMHADFTLGIFVYGLFVSTELLDLLRKKRQLSAFLSVPVPFLLSLLLTLINPYGISLWSTLMKETNTFQFYFISEWLPFDVSHSFFPFVIIVYTAVILNFLIVRQSKYPLWYVLSLAFFGLLALRSMYFFRTFLILSAICLFDLTSYIVERADAFFDKVSFRRFKKVFILFGAFFAVILALSFMYRVSVTLDESLLVDKGPFPYSAVEYIKNNPLQGKMYNRFGWGGYLIWKLPDYKTFVDGRMNSWRDNGTSVFEDYMSIERNPAKYASLLSHYGIDWVLEAKTSPLVNYLKTSSEWELIYEDSLSTIYRRLP